MKKLILSIKRRLFWTHLIVRVLPFVLCCAMAIGVTLVWAVLLAGGTALIVTVAICTARFLGVDV